jgi:alkylglycerol monooxygenase
MEFLNTSLMILYALPAFLSLMFLEFLYGISRKNNTYRFNDTFCSLTLGVLSRIPPALHLGISGLVYGIAADHFSIKLLAYQNWITWVMAFFLYDFLYYWKHRLSHERSIFWASHVVHHQSEDFNLGTALRQTGSGFLLTWIFFTPMFAIGIPVEVFISVASANLVYQFWVHTEHVGSLGVLDRLLVTPSNHRVHHARNTHYIDANYGGVLIVWDRIFGTFRPEEDSITPIYGTSKPLRSWNPIWANIEIYSQLLRDFWVTELWRNKLRVLYSRTGWRPEDVATRFPNVHCQDCDDQKYESDSDISTIIFVIVQFLIWLVLVIFLMSDIRDLYFNDRLIALFLLFSVGITVWHLKGKLLSWIFEGVRSVLVILLIFLVGVWDVGSQIVQVLALQASFNLVFLSILGVRPFISLLHRRSGKIFP